MIRSGDRLENPVTGEVLVFHRTSEETIGESVLVETIVRPHGFVAAAHVHPFQAERLEVLEGVLGLRVGEKKFVAPARRRRRGRAGHAPSLLECRRGRGTFPLRGTARAPVRIADRDDVLIRRGGKDQPERDAEPAPARTGSVPRVSRGHRPHGVQLGGNGSRERLNVRESRAMQSPPLRSRPHLSHRARLRSRTAGWSSARRAGAPPQSAPVQGRHRLAVGRVSA